MTEWAWLDGAWREHIDDSVDATVREALRRVRYLRDDERGEALMHALRHLIGRAGPSPMEVRLLIGLARQMEWVMRYAELPDDGADGMCAFSRSLPVPLE